jgi:L-aspartate oxidase
MDAFHPELRAADVAVIGTGVAGLTAALGAAAAGMRVHLLTKCGLRSGSSPWAQGGVAAAVGAGDSPELHAADTVAAGAGLVDPRIAAVVARDGVLAVRRLIELGTAFDRGELGELALGREAAHSRRRILHARGDATGTEMVRALCEKVWGERRIECFEGVFAERLVVTDSGVAGVLSLGPGGVRSFHAASRVVLATGGSGQLYRFTTNPPESTGDGLLLAADAGARLIDVEFVQFHPTALASRQDPLPLLTEALRGEGAVVVDDRGERFLAAEHEAAELAPRDVVARAIWRRLAAGRRVFLDARDAVGDAFPRRFPSVFAACRDAGFDPRIERLPIVPAAHYHMGGVAVDERGRTGVAGLWACGEVASTGVHGANRLASNSLLEALVIGARVAGSLAEEGSGGRPPRNPGDVDPEGTPPSRSDPRSVAPGLRRRVRSLAWRHLGLVRERSGLRHALARLSGWWEALPAGASEVRALVAAGTLVAAAALRREESRGAHFRSDFPGEREAWRFRQALSARSSAEWIRVHFEERDPEREEATG